MNKPSRRMVRMFLTTGGLFILFGFAQFVFFMGLDRLGVIEVGNALGLGLLLWISVAVGFLFLLLGFVLAALLGKDSPPRSRVAGSPFDGE
jgi:type IV secretory pathway TrbD component